MNYDGDDRTRRIKVNSAPAITIALAVVLDAKETVNAVIESVAGSR